MAQSDQVVQNATFPAVRADINDNFEALFTQSSGNSAPAVTVAFQPWVDTSSSPPVWKVRNASNTNWITIGVLDANFQVGGVTPIANGGTGATTATAAINALLPSQTGNSGEFLTTDGTNVSWDASGGGLIRAPQLLTSGTSYTTPAGCTLIYVECNGGGQGGSGGFSLGLFNSGPGQFGGNAGAYSAKFFTVTAGSSYTYAIGAGGTGGLVQSTSPPPQNGGSGGTTTFTVGSTTISAPGGATTPSVGTTGDIDRFGTAYSGAIGGSSFFKAGGTLAVAGGLGAGGGAGASGGAGAAGGSGIIRVWEYA